MAVDDIGEGVAALVAALACGFAATRSAGRLSLAWALLAASAASWCAGEIVWSVNEVGLGAAVPFPSLADVGHLTAVPLAVAGVLAFSTSPLGTATRWRVWLDGLIIAVSLLFVAWTAGLDHVYADKQDPLLERAVDLAYPLGDILIGTVLVLALRRSSGQQQGRLLLLLGGLAANSVADSAFAYLIAGGDHGLLGNILDAGWVIGYLMIGLAALWPSGPVDATVQAPIDVWQLALPWLAILAAGVAALINALLGNAFDVFMSALAGTLVILLMLSQFFAHRDSLSMLVKSQRSEAVLSDLFDHAPVGVVRIGPDMRIASANPRFCDLLALPTEAVVGHSLSNYFAARQSGDLAKFEALSQGAVDEIDGDVEMAGKDATNRWLHWSATAVRNADGSVEYFVAMVDDTTARHAAEQAAAAHLAVLEKLNRVKSEFLEMTRHEFRSALVGIQGLSELIRDVEHLNPGEVKEFAADIYEGARRLDQMINEVLSLDRAETNGAQLRLVPTDLNAEVAAVVEAARSSRDRPVLCMSLDPGLPTVPADPAKIKEVVEILVHNAIKYSPDDGQVVVSSAVEDGHAVVTVKDQGVGVRADFDNRLFGQGDLYANSPIRKVVGTGFDLAIARQIVELHGGRIWVDRIDGAGSNFHFTLPVRSSTVQPGTPQAGQVGATR